MNSEPQLPLHHEEGAHGKLQHRFEDRDQAGIERGEGGKKKLVEVKEMNKSAKAEIESWFRNKGHEGRKMCDDLAKMEEGMNSEKLDHCCGLSGAASIGVGLRPWTFARPLFLGQKCREASDQRNMLVLSEHKPLQFTHGIQGASEILKRCII